MYQNNIAVQQASKIAANSFRPKIYTGRNFGMFKEIPKQICWGLFSFARLHIDSPRSSKRIKRITRNLSKKKNSEPHIVKRAK